MGGAQAAVAGGWGTQAATGGLLHPGGREGDQGALVAQGDGTGFLDVLLCFWGSASTRSEALVRASSWALGQQGASQLHAGRGGGNAASSRCSRRPSCRRIAS